MTSVYDRLGVPTIINAKGTATRLSGGIMRREVADAMVEASHACVDIAALQAAASREIAAVTGAEAGYVASGASACLLLATAACIAGHDLSAMARLPDTASLKNEVVMARSQRNFYDHAVRAAGARIVEVGLPDRFAGAGVRDAEGWEIDAAISERTAAVFYVADALARPSLPEVVEVAHGRGVPVFVDAAAQLPPQSNLRRFIAEGADLVAFSGGKVIGGPQASGFLCGRHDLIMSAALQHLDFDIPWARWQPPPLLIDKTGLKGVPQHGIGRSCKAGKEEIVGLLTALRLFVEEGDAARHARWLKRVNVMATGLRFGGVDLLYTDDRSAVPQVKLTLKDMTAEDFLIRLAAGTPSVHADASVWDSHVVFLSPLCLGEGDELRVAEAVNAILA
ncbi:hypothetical protein [Aestuariivirga sp.]|uniref:hypothetical protein n=1 Tax=Aestuariivirga sp. TaxID=2650926 RepID=UPI0039E6D493